jgi:hypothetical protein
MPRFPFRRLLSSRAAPGASESPRALRRAPSFVARLRTVNAIVEQIGHAGSVRKEDLHLGDRLQVATENSVYSIQFLGDATYRISGGWFDRQGISPVRTSIAGCTWGGSVIKNDIVAACGLHLEFGNRVVTSRIRRVHVIRDGARTARLRPVDSGELLPACYGPRWGTSSAG